MRDSSCVAYSFITSNAAVNFSPKSHHPSDPSLDAAQTESKELRNSFPSQDPLRRAPLCSHLCHPEKGLWFDLAKEKYSSCQDLWWQISGTIGQCPLHINSQAEFWAIFQRIGIVGFISLSLGQVTQQWTSGTAWLLFWILYSCISIFPSSCRSNRKSHLSSPNSPCFR